MVRDKKLDIHKSKYRIELVKKTLMERSPENGSIVCRFLERLMFENKSSGRIANYAESSKRILVLSGDDAISSWTKKQIESIHRKIVDLDCENSVKKDTLTTLKRLYHFAVCGEIADKSKGREYHTNVSWIVPGAFSHRNDKIQAQDLLTNREILDLVNAVKKIGGRYIKRNIALLFAMFEGAYRPGELINIRLRGLEFEENFVRVYTTGKTGPKSLTLVASSAPIRDWLAEHPDSCNSDAFLFYHHNADGVIPYHSLHYMLKRAQKIAGIKKHVWPYLFRHTALTQYSKTMGSVAKIYGNWSHGSNMLAHYEHLASSDQEDAVLRMHNLKKESKESSILYLKACNQCKHLNCSDKGFCTICGSNLSDALHRAPGQSDPVDEKDKLQEKIQQIECLCQKLDEMEQRMQKQMHMILYGLG